MLLKFIDPKLRSLIQELNLTGVKTTCSCAGHRRRGRLEEGYISMDKPVNMKILKDTLAKYEIKPVYKDRWNGRLLVTFPGLGGARRAQNESLAFKTRIPPSNYLYQSEALFIRNLERLGIHHLSKTSVLARYALSHAIRGEEVPKDIRKKIGRRSDER